MSKGVSASHPLG